MSMYEPDLAGQFVLLKGIHFWNPNFASEMATIVTALGSDTTSHDRTIESAPVPLRIGADKTALTNDALLLVNMAKAGNMSPDSIIGAIDAALGTAYHPIVVNVPFVSCAPIPAAIGSVCTSTTGIWAGAPSSYSYQWTRNGANIGGATSASYTLVSADVGGQSVACIVSATNSSGTTAAPPSNAIGT